MMVCDELGHENRSIKVCYYLPNRLQRNTRKPNYFPCYYAEYLEKMMVH